MSIQNKSFDMSIKKFSLFIIVVVVNDYSSITISLAVNFVIAPNLCSRLLVATSYIILPTIYYGN